MLQVLRVNFPDQNPIIDKGAFQNNLLQVNGIAKSQVRKLSAQAYFSGFKFKLYLDPFSALQMIYKYKDIDFSDLESFNLCLWHCS